MLLFLIAIAAAGSGCARLSPAQSSRVPKEASKSNQTAAAAAPATRVEVVQPQLRTIRRVTQEPGQVEAFEVTPIYAKVAGYVAKWNVDIGSKVAQGQVLAVLSVPELEAEFEQKKAMVEEAQAKLAQAKAGEEVARANLASAQARATEVQAGIKRVQADLARWQAEMARVEQLFSERALTGSLLDETRSKRLAAESAREEIVAQARTAEAAIQSAQALIAKAQADTAAASAKVKVAQLEARRVEALKAYMVISAPCAGVVTQRSIDVGDLTQPGAQGIPMFTITRDDPVRIVVSVPEIDAAAVQPGHRAWVRIQALSGKELESRVARTSWSLDPRNRTLRAEIDLPNPSGELRPGFYVQATIALQEHLGALSVPSTALLRQDGRVYCVAVDQGRAVRKVVEPGLTDAGYTEILSGLASSDIIVRSAPASLADGQPVVAAAADAGK